MTQAAQTQKHISVLTVPTLSVSSGASYCVHGLIGSIPLQLLVDTGAAISLLSTDVWRRINTTGSPIVLQQWTGKKLVGVNGAPLCVKGCVHAHVSIGSIPFKGTFIVSGDLLVDAILGLDFIERHHCVIDCENKVLKFPRVNLSVGMQNDGNAVESQQSGTARLVTTQKVIVSPESELEIMLKPTDSKDSIAGVWMVENNPKMPHGVIVARAIVCPNNGLIPVRILNPRDCSILLKKGAELAMMERVECDSISNVSTVNMSGEVSPADQEVL